MANTHIAQRSQDWALSPILTGANERWNNTRRPRRNNSWASNGSRQLKSSAESINSFECGDQQGIPEVLRVGRSDSGESGRQSNRRRAHLEASRNAYDYRRANSEWESQRNQDENERSWKLQLEQDENERRWEIERHREENDRHWEAELRREENERNWEIERKREEDERNNHSALERDRCNGLMIGRKDDKPLPRLPSWEDDRTLRRRDSSGSIDIINEDTPRPLRISRGSAWQEGSARDHNSPLALRGGGIESQHGGSTDLDTPGTERPESLETGLRTRRTSSTARRLVLTFRPQRPPRTESASQPSNSIPVSPLSVTQVGTEHSISNSIDLNSQLSIVSIIKYHDKDVQCDLDEKPKKKKRQAAADGSLPTGSRLAILLVCTCMAIFLQALVSLSNELKNTGSNLLSGHHNHLHRDTSHHAGVSLH
jgi:hypothetical protein